MNKQRKIKTAVITAGGYGTRFLPFTKVIPKEMLPIVDIPSIQLIVEECLNAGIDRIIIITRPKCSIIKNYFNRNIPLEKYLLNHKKDFLIKKIDVSLISQKIEFVEENMNISYGNAAPLLTIKNLLQKENAFAVLFADDIVISREPYIKSLIQTFSQENCEAVVGVQKVAPKEVSNYGNVQIRRGTINEIEKIIQKPSPQEIVSDLVIFSRLILTPKIFSYLERDRRYDEPDIGKALNLLAKDYRVLAQRIRGGWVTIGDPLNYIKANIEFMLTNKFYKNKIIEFIKEKLKAID